MSLPEDRADTAIFLTDNGSLRPAATFWLRQAAELVSNRCGMCVEPVSLLHSHKIPPAELDGRAAEIVEQAMPERLARGVRRFVVLPFFVGPSRALTDYLPERIERLQLKACVDAQVSIADPLCPCEASQDPGIVTALRDRLCETLAGIPEDCSNIPVALVDHGSPEPLVTAVRDRVAEQLDAVLRSNQGSRLGSVIACSMERRPGDAYAFNEPLLETVLQRLRGNVPHVIIAQLFLSPGRHAGEGGDIQDICAQHAGGTVCHTTTPLGHHPQVIELLARRLKGA